MSRHCSIWTSTQRVAKRWNCEGFDFHGRCFVCLKHKAWGFDLTACCLQNEFLSGYVKMLVTHWIPALKMLRNICPSLQSYLFCSHSGSLAHNWCRSLSRYFFVSKKNTKIRTMKSCLYFFHFFSHVNLFFAELGLFLCKPSFETSWILWQRTSMKETGIVST